MPKSKLTLVLLLLGSAGLIVLFLFLPKLPASTAEKAADAPAVDQNALKIQQAMELVNGANPMQGIMMLLDMVKEDSTNVDAHLALAVNSIKSGQIEKAVYRLEKVRVLRPDDANYQTEVGLQYIDLDSTNRALRCFERTLEIDSTENNALFFTAQIYERQGNYAQAIRNYQALLRHNSDEAVIAKVNEFINNLSKKLNP